MNPKPPVRRIFVGSICVVLSAFFLARAADLTSPVSTPNGQLYNQLYRDTKDGNNSVTSDQVSANSYANAITTFTQVKATGGYLDNITLLAACANGSTNYVLVDSSAAALNGASYQTIISTVPGNGSAPVNIPYHVRFLNGLLVSVFSSTCPVTVSYR